MPEKCNGNIYRKIGPREDISWRAPIDGPFVDDEGYRVEEEAYDCSGYGSPAQSACALLDCHSWR